MNQSPVYIYISVDCVGKMDRIDCLLMWAAQFDVSCGVHRDWNVWSNLEELPEKSPPISILFRAKDSNFLFTAQSSYCGCAFYRLLIKCVSLSHHHKVTFPHLQIWDLIFAQVLTLKFIVYLEFHSFFNHILLE